MKFEYNGNLLEEERINLVAKEIINKYPQINIEKAQEAAKLEGKISENINTDDILNRLYNIMLVNSDNKSLVTIIFTDYLNLLKSTNIQINNKYIVLAEEINDYLQNYNEFPIISDYK